MTAKKLEVSIPMSLLSFSKSVDRGSYEKLSIRDSARSLKKYGSTSNKNVTKNENYIKHFVSNSDTLQGIALKYNVTIEQIRRANKLWASDSLFLREYLLVPQPENANKAASPTETPPSTSSRSSLTSPGVESANHNRTSLASSSTRSSFDDENISDFLSKIDASIASTKEVVKKVTRSSEYGTDLPPPEFRRKPHADHAQHQNNNIEHRLSNPQQPVPLNTVVTAQQVSESSKNEVKIIDKVNTHESSHIDTSWPKKRGRIAPLDVWNRWKNRTGNLTIRYNKF